MNATGEIPIIEAEWVQFKARVVDRAAKAFGDPGPMIGQMLHDAFYAGALVMFTFGVKANPTERAALVDQVEAYYQEAIRRASERRPQA